MDDSRFATMISKIAHELRSPLTSVKGFSATLVSRWDRFDDKQRLDLVKAINGDADRMARIVSEVLDLARLESGTLALHPRTFILQEVIGETIAGLGQGTERIKVVLPPDLTVRVDPDRLQHVMFNVLENALRFSRDAEILLEADPLGHGGLRVSVQDRGVGISPDRISSVFDGPGPRGQSAVPKGTGLGLYLSKRLVEAHGGTMRVESEENVGSKFFIEIPEGLA